MPQFTSYTLFLDDVRLKNDEARMKKEKKKKIAAKIAPIIDKGNATTKAKAAERNRVLSDWGLPRQRIFNRVHDEVKDFGCKSSIASPQHINRVIRSRKMHWMHLENNPGKESNADIYPPLGSDFKIVKEEMARYEATGECRNLHLTRYFLDDVRLKNDEAGMKKEIRKR